MSDTERTARDAWNAALRALAPAEPGKEKKG